MKAASNLLEVVFIHISWILIVIVEFFVCIIFDRASVWAWASGSGTEGGAERIAQR